MFLKVRAPGTGIYDNLKRLLDRAVEQEEHRPSTAVELLVKTAAEVRERRRRGNRAKRARDAVGKEEVGIEEVGREVGIATR